MGFRLSIPTKIYFGRGILYEALEKEKGFITGNVLVVAAPSAVRNGFAEKIIGQVGEFPGVKKTAIFSEFTANPKISEVNMGIRYACEISADLIIGVGGGSAIDTAKAVAVGAGAGERIDRYFSGQVQPDGRTLPVIAVPTTAGTGSELSRGSILSCPERKMKTGVRGDSLYPAVAIVDPQLTDTVPVGVAMETGFDVLAHAVESYVSRAANRFTETLSEQAVALVAKALPMIKQTPGDKRSREDMSYASMAMGINLGNASTALPHRMQYPVGALTDTGHGLGLAALYPAWIELTYVYSKEKFNRIGELMSGKPCFCKEDVLDVFGKFMGQTCGNFSLTDLGFREEDAGKLAGMVTGNISLDPAGGESGIIKAIYEKALGR